MKSTNILRTESKSENNISTEKFSLDINKFKNTYEGNKPKQTLKDHGTMPKATCEKTIQILTASKKWDSYETTFSMICGLVQTGGSNKKERTFELNDKTLSSKELLEAIEKASEGTKKHYTIRQFCRTMADEIVNFSIIMNLEGDLIQKMRLDVSEISPEEACWCSNFQTRNPNCPQKVREWLVKNYKEKFRT